MLGSVHLHAFPVWLRGPLECVSSVPWLLLQTERICQQAGSVERWLSVIQTWFGDFAVYQLRGPGSPLHLIKPHFSMGTIQGFG